ncbi:hypothetical protein ERO13_D10G053400v2 [Gossypium hirsutum]|uniref:Uncharacterized protein n=3 Tax=Gossypium TaxID=3633 RepID=A0A5J5PPR0_GOSBA|nr:hypothetical protein ES319_D10G056500v1 [Gossypium barbadense]KAG4124645.1 hypothetical protein ERO13_D10G053400v2 [Gossypium hirsutum]TYH48322.1 hypothetical protein ES332_D10G060100v1 [Gossypium tomentosum]TYI59753.1 hypothetical protein E1A91_D10G059600v1 [Gossypium mustelinum]
MTSTHLLSIVFTHLDLGSPQDGTRSSMGLASGGFSCLSAAESFSDVDSNSTMVIKCHPKVYLPFRSTSSLPKRSSPTIPAMMFRC